MAASERHLAHGREALARSDWTEARAAFEAALAAEEAPEAREGLGYAALWLDDLETGIEAQEQAYRLYRERGDQRGAARAATWIGVASYSYRRNVAVASGWLERAERLLEHAGQVPERAWLAAYRAHMALLGEHDPERARAHLSEAAELARATGQPDVELLTLALDGLLLVTQGEVAPGMRRLDEATAAAVGGDLVDPIAVENVCCYQIYACKRVRDFDRAAQWCERMEEISRRWASRGTFAICRTHYADVLIWRGHWKEAERQLGLAEQAFGVRRPGAADAHVRLGELRRREGRLEEAERIFRDAESHPLAALGLAAVALERGDGRRAADLVERYLRRISREERTERVAGLELLVRARLALGDRESAGEALEELRSIASALDTDPVRASAALVGGMLRADAGDGEAARRELEDAVDLYERSGAPYESARARLELARVLAELGRHEDAREEAREASRRLRKLGAGESGAPHESNGLTRRELEILRLLAQGQSNQQIAARLVLSVRTVERHISNVYAKLGATGRTARAAAAAYAARLGLPS